MKRFHSPLDDTSSLKLNEHLNEIETTETKTEQKKPKEKTENEIKKEALKELKSEQQKKREQLETMTDNDQWWRSEDAKKLIADLNKTRDSQIRLNPRWINDKLFVADAKDINSDSNKLTDTEWKTKHIKQIQLIFKAYGYPQITKQTVDVIKTRWNNCFIYIQRGFTQPSSSNSPAKKPIFGANISTLASIKEAVLNDAEEVKEEIRPAKKAGGGGKVLKENSLTGKLN